MQSLMCFENNKVEVLMWNEAILFNPYDVGRCLELSDSAVRMSMSKMSSNQVVRLTNLDVNNIDIRKLNNRGENFLTESGVYKLVFKSRKAEAERFTDWIADEVLPSIRKTGGYTTQPQTPPINYTSMQKLTFGGHPVMTVAQFVSLFNLSKRTILDWTEKVCSKHSVKMLSGEPLARYGKENDIKFTGGSLFIYNEFESLNLANALKAPQDVIAFIKDYFKPTYNPNISEKDFKLALQQADLLYKIAKDIQDPYAKEQNLKAVTAILINIGLWTEAHHGYNGITSEWSINSTEGWNKRAVMLNAKRV